MTRKITNAHFMNFKKAVNLCCNNSEDDDTIISDMASASYDSDGEKICFYSSEFMDKFINMEAIKLDDISKKRKNMLEMPGNFLFEEQPAVDAVCINSCNEWFFIEFKNAKVNDKITSIKKKMLSSLWFCFYMLSKSNKDDDILNNDVLKFSREHATYIIVGRRDKNEDVAENIRELEAYHKHYQPYKLRQFINYYFKDVYMLTEFEFRDFIRTFKI